MERNKVVEIKNLSKKYGKNKNNVIEDINIECYENEIVGILGHNGAGKSTIIKCLTGFYDFNDGYIKICGYDIKKDPLNAKKNFGYVPDNRAMFDKMSGIEYINFIADLQKVNKDVRKERIEKMQDFLKLGEQINNQISTYSHGMRQKICLMASLIHNPKLWILDEPLTGLDPLTASSLSEYMKEYKAKGNLVLYSSHNLDAIERNCDRVYIINKGRIIKDIDLRTFNKEYKNKTLSDVYFEIFEGNYE